MTDARLTGWLLDSDPALAWQVERDLVGAPEETWQATRARVATEGFGAELLAHQDTAWPDESGSTPTSPPVNPPNGSPSRRSGY